MSAPAYTRSFARHETFHPRFGWLRKAVLATDRDPAVFLAPDATSRLGVGKNMVRAIRYWGEAFGVIEATALPDRPRLAGWTPSRLGRFLLGDTGVDPYLEETASLWLLHWQLLRRGSLAPTWYLTFNRFPQRDFSAEELVAWLARELARDGIEAVATSSLRKDVSCLLRMYGPAASAHAETTLTSPFSALRLVDPVDGRGSRMRLTYGPKAGLPPELVAIVALEHMRVSASGARSVHVGTLASAETGPGHAFGLSETEIIQALEVVASRHPDIEVGVLAGSRRMSVAHEPIELSRRLFRGLYDGPSFDLGGFNAPGVAA